MYHEATLMSICNDLEFIYPFITANSLAYENYSK